MNLFNIKNMTWVNMNWTPIGSEFVAMNGTRILYRNNKSGELRTLRIGGVWNLTQILSGQFYDKKQ